MDSSTTALWVGLFPIARLVLLLNWYIILYSKSTPTWNNCYIEIPVLNANSVDPDQIQLSAPSDPGLHCLPITLLVVSGLKWVKDGPIIQVKSELNPSTQCIAWPWWLYTNFNFCQPSANVTFFFTLYPEGLCLPLVISLVSKSQVKVTVWCYFSRTETVTVSEKYLCI